MLNVGSRRSRAIAHPSPGSHLFWRGKNTSVGPIAREGHVGISQSSTRHAERPFARIQEQSQKPKPRQCGWRRLRDRKNDLLCVWRSVCKRKPLLPPMWASRHVVTPMRRMPTTHELRPPILSQLWASQNLE